MLCDEWDENASLPSTIDEISLISRLLYRQFWYDSLTELQSIDPHDTFPIMRLPRVFIGRLFPL